VEAWIRSGDQVPERLAAGVEDSVVLLRELRAQGYTGSYTILKAAVQPLRPRCAVTATVRFETKPGEAHVDFGRPRSSRRPGSGTGSAPS
jgi:transposase